MKTIPLSALDAYIEAPTCDANEPLALMFSEPYSGLPAIKYLALGWKPDWANETLTYDPDRLDEVLAVTAEVCEAYDDDGEAWANLGLGGDDDVDYNGGYVAILVEAVQAYEAS